MGMFKSDKRDKICMKYANAKHNETEILCRILFSYSSTHLTIDWSCNSLIFDS